MGLTKEMLSGIANVCKGIEKEYVIKENIKPVEIDKAIIDLAGDNIITYDKNCYSDGVCVVEFVNKIKIYGNHDFYDYSKVKSVAIEKDDAEYILNNEVESILRRNSSGKKYTNIPYIEKIKTLCEKYLSEKGCDLSEKLESRLNEIKQELSKE